MNEEVLIVTEKETVDLKEHIGKEREERRVKVKLSIKLKYSLFTAGIITIVALIIGFYTLTESKKNLTEEMLAKARVSSQMLANNIGEVFEDITARHQILKNNIKKDLIEISLIGPEGKIIDHSDDKKWEHILNAEVSEQVSPLYYKIPESVLNLIKNQGYFIKETSEKVELFFPVKSEGTISGYLRVIFTKKFINEKILRVRKGILLFSLLTILVGIFLSYILTSIIIKPVKKLEEGARIVGMGDLNYVIEVNTSDELGVLAEEFNRMTTKLKEAQQEIIEKERYEEQLEIARRIQENLLPDKLPQLKEIELSAYYKAAKGVGGDYYDVIEFGKNKIGLIIADVSGKGVPAALVMVMIRTMFHTIGKVFMHTSRTLEVINNGITGRLTGDKFATMFYLLYDYKTGKLQFSNAGHNVVFLYRKRENKIYELDTEGIPVGVLPDSTYGIDETQMEEGDMILLYTDGITEAMDEKENLFGSDRVKNIIKENHNLPAEELKQKIIDEITKFTGTAPQHDDMTLVLMKVKEITNNRKTKSLNYKLINPLDPYSIVI